MLIRSLKILMRIICFWFCVCFWFRIYFILLLVVSITRSATSTIASSSCMCNSIWFTYGYLYLQWHTVNSSCSSTISIKIVMPCSNKTSSKSSSSYKTISNSSSSNNTSSYNTSANSTYTTSTYPVTSAMNCCIVMNDRGSVLNV